MDREPIQPLRILKGVSNSPSKMSTSTARPLSEVKPMGIRRNSGNLNSSPQSQKHDAKLDSSPFDPSPGNNPTLAFWKNKEILEQNQVGDENAPFRPVSPSPERRPSLENLKKASRVHDNIFARDLDQGHPPFPAQPTDKHFGRGRPLGARPENGTNGTSSPADQAAVLPGRFRGMGELETRIPWLGRTSPPKWSPSRPNSAQKEQYSPQKSSLSSNSRYAATTQFSALGTPSSPDEGTEILGQATTPRPTIRHPKSVSFDIAPPQINEYEEITPDPSSVASGSREGSYDSEVYDLDNEYEQEQQPLRDDSFDDSLEDVDKTPVVMPEDWRFMSPDAANTDLAHTFDDPFEGQPQRQTSHRRGLSASNEFTIARSDSVRSSGEHRPLPPLPGISLTSSHLPQLTMNIGATPKAVRTLSANRQTRDSPMPWEDRLRLLSIQNRSTEKVHIPTKTAEEPFEKPCSATEDELQHYMDNIKIKLEEDTAAPMLQPPTRISRESILRKVRSKQSSFDEGYDDYSFADDTEEHEEDMIQETEYRYANLDPDVPIPSREESDFCEGKILDSRVDDEDDGEAGRFDSPYGDDSDSTQNRLSQSISASEEVSMLHHKSKVTDIREEYQVSSREEESADQDGQLSDEAPVSDTFRILQTSTASTVSATTTSSLPETKVASQQTNSAANDRPTTSIESGITLPDFSSLLSNIDFSLGLGLESYLLPSSLAEHSQSRNVIPEPTKKDRTMSSERPYTPVKQVGNNELHPYDENDDDEDAGTPDSVIHHSLEDTTEYMESPVIPEPVATIKAPGAKLKTRPSATPADIRAMAAARRLVSEEKPLPRLPDDDEDSGEDVEGAGDAGESDEGSGQASHKHEPAQRISSLQVKLDVPLEHDTVAHGFGLEDEFDKVIETQKRGYVMRENAKVVVASNRKFSDDTTSLESALSETQPSPTRQTRGSRRPSQQTWKAEPWNGKSRRQSTRRTNIVPEKGVPSGSAPPLPGMDSNVTGAMDTLAEDEMLAQEHDSEEGERGRLFVKVVGIKELDLPLPRDERCHFQLTLDNGLHCVTTNWAELGRTAPVGQEFELVVFEDLEFQLTLQTRLKEPKSITPSVDMSTTPSTKTTKTSKFKNLLRSPQKRRELEQKQRDEEEAYTTQQRQREIEMKRASSRPTAWDLQHEIVGPDGNFARAYISLSSYEKQAFGRPYNVDVPCFNEWAVEDKAITSSTRSKLGGLQRRPPYKIGKIELQLLYIPKPRGTGDEDMPRSISAAMRQLREAETAVEQQFEGHLSQEGGDCPFWRRRFFKLQGTKLTAYHESTRQLRATINLTRAIQLIDDRTSLTRTPDLSTSPTKGKGRRKSAFAEDEEGYMFVEEGFRIRFANGESIDFYAESTQQKEQWMAALSEVVGKNGAAGKISWTDAVLARERTQQARAALEKPNMLKEEKVPLRGASKPTSASPVRKPVANGGGAAAAFNGHSLPTPGRENVSSSEKQSPPKHWSLPGPKAPESPGRRLEKRRQAVRSMMF